jgi:putative tryptophan/tyrosine transport system substrate-binding protein
VTTRREFITLLGGAAAAWPVAARAQQPGMRRVGVLMGYGQSDPSAQSFFAGFVQSLKGLGWIVGQNVLIEDRWAGGDINRIQKFAKELVEMHPDVILSNTTPVTVALHRETHTIPIIFVIVSDPVGAGLITSLAQPGGNITGFINIEASMGGKWLELLKEIAPGVRRAAIMFNPDTAPGGGSYFTPSFQSAARSLGIEPISAAVRSDADIESAITALGRESDGGLVVSADSFMVVHRRPIISLATQNNVPAIFFTPAFPKDGGLLAYGADSLDVFRRAGPYVDRVLRGAKPNDLPVQVPVKFELVINLKTAKALGLQIPDKLLALADEVIE